MKNDSENKIINFLSERLSVSSNQILCSHSLFHDLGVDGDDALELIADYSSKFNVDISDFKIDEFFGVEVGTNPLALVREIIFKSSYNRKKKLLVSDLIKGETTGKLVTSID